MSRPKGQLPRPIFAKIAPHEFLVANLGRSADQKAASNVNAAFLGTRPNGRTPDEPRPFDVHSGSLSQAHGSAAVRLGETSVVCGVRGEILPVAGIPNYRPSATIDASSDEENNRRQLREYDLLVPNLELNTGAAPEFLPGGPPSVLAQTLSTRLYSLLHNSGLVDAEPLKIWYHPQKRPEEETEGGMDVDAKEDEEEEEPQAPEIKAYWTLYIDIVFLSFDGNPFDAAWAAILAALHNTRLPTARWDADRAQVTCVRPSPTSAVTLNLRGLPVALTALVCVENRKKQQLQSRPKTGSGESSGAYWILVDPDRLEESQCREAVTIVVDQSSNSTVVRSLSKSGGVLVGPAEVKALVALAEKRWAALSNTLTKQP